MNTFILMWRPAISSYKMENLEEEMGYFEDADFNWSVWEHDKAHEGDRFFLVRVGEGKTGVVMSGYFTSEPYEGEDWSGKGRQTFYMDFRPDHVFHPDNAPLLSTEQLTAAIPDFDWAGGHSGRMLTEAQAAKLEDVWDEHLCSLDDSIYDDETIAVRLEEITVDGAVSEAVYAHRNQKDMNGEPYILHVLAVGLRGTTKEEIIVGFLHDVLNHNKYYNYYELALDGATRQELTAIKLLTREKGITYDDYIRRIADSDNVLAIAVKINDLEDKLERAVKGNHPRKKSQYQKALAILKEVKS